MKRMILAAVAASAAIAAPASAVTFLFGGSTANVGSVSTSAGGVDLTVTARHFTAAPGGLTSLNQTVASGLVSVTAPGVGVAGGASGPQIDTNQANNREGLLVQASRKLTIDGLKLSYVDSNDTLQIYGVKADGSLVDLGFNGTIRSGFGGTVGFSHTSANQGTTTLALNAPLPAFDTFLFTTRVGGDVRYNNDLGQGYVLDSISAGIVPEPATWAMLIAGFGLVGASLRRRNPLAA